MCVYDLLLIPKQSRKAKKNEKMKYCIENIYKFYSQI